MLIIAKLTPASSMRLRLLAENTSRPGAAVMGWSLDRSPVTDGRCCIWLVLSAWWVA
jgi:hypothetical protein